MLQPGDTIERYEVVRTIGIGGHATVYLLKHRTLGSEHALKVVNLHRPDIRARLLQEGRIQANLQHPNIVPVTDVLEVGGLQALLMPFVDGPDLRLWLEDHRPVSSPMAVHLFREIVDAVGYAHDQGLVHRDLKPANILMDRHGERWRPRITDFGIAKITGSEGAIGTRSGIGMGTPAYMAPEQVQNAAHVDHRADIFALGCLLYELLLGRRLFAAANPLAIAAQIANPEPVELDAARAVVDPTVLAVLEGCLEKDRERRFPDCDLILQTLQPLQTPLAPSIRSTGSRTATATAPDLQAPSEGSALLPGAPDPIVTPDAPLAPPAAATGTPLEPLFPASAAHTPAVPLVPSIEDHGAAPTPPTKHTADADAIDALPTPVPLPPPQQSFPSGPTWKLGLLTLSVAVVLGWFTLSADPPVSGPVAPTPKMTARPSTTTTASSPGPGGASDSIERSTPSAQSSALPSTRPDPGTPPAPGDAPAPNRSVEGDTQPSKGPVPPAQGTPEPAPTAPPPSPASATPTAGVTNGILHIDSRPYAQIWINGTPRGETDQRFELPAGSHRIRLQAQDEPAHNTTIQVEADGNSTYCWDFGLNDTC